MDKSSRGRGAQASLPPSSGGGPKLPPIPEVVQEAAILLRNKESVLGFRELRAVLDTLTDDVKEIALEIHSGDTTFDILERIIDEHCVGRIPTDNDYDAAKVHLRSLLRQLLSGLQQ